MNENTQTSTRIEVDAFCDPCCCCEPEPYVQEWIEIIQQSKTEEHTPAKVTDSK